MEKNKKLTLKDFFQSFWGHIGALQLINLLFLIPVAVFGGAIFVVSWFWGNINIFVCTLLVPLLMPFMVGMAYVFKNMLYGECEHPVRDYIKGIKDNLKQSIFYGLFMYVIVSGLWLSFSMYRERLAEGGWVWLLFVMSVILTVIILFMSFQIPVMIVTLQLRLIDIYKNALIFVFAGIGGNLKTLLSLLLVGSVLGMIILISASVVPLAGIIVASVLFLWIGFSLCGYIISFNAYPTTKKLAIDAYNNKSATLSKEPTNPYEDLSYEELEPYLEGDPDEYVYVSGRMMKRSSVQALAKSIRNSNA